jgi:hypothetical protein
MAQLEHPFAKQQQVTSSKAPKMIHAESVDALTVVGVSVAACVAQNEFAEYALIAETNLAKAANNTRSFIRHDQRK